MARIAIVDDHPLLLEGVVQFLAASGHEVVLATTDASAAAAALANGDPAVDLLILDVSMPGGGGLELLSGLRDEGGNLPVILLSAGLTPQETLKAVSLNVNGIVLKDNDPSLLLSCVDTVLSGRRQLDSELMEKALQFNIAAAAEAASGNGDAGLTTREAEIVGLVRQGLANRAIAQRSGLSEGTVKVHLHNIFRKTGVRSRAELIVAGQGRQ